MREPELLVPASSLEVLKVAVIYGADAVYIGGEAFGLRAKAKNFTLEEMKEGVEFAHERGVKVFVTANIHPPHLTETVLQFSLTNYAKKSALCTATPKLPPVVERLSSTHPFVLTFARERLSRTAAKLLVCTPRQKSLKTRQILSCV